MQECRLQSETLEKGGTSRGVGGELCLLFRNGRQEVDEDASNGYSGSDGNPPSMMRSGTQPATEDANPG